MFWTFLGYIRHALHSSAYYWQRFSFNVYKRFYSCHVFYVFNVLKIIMNVFTTMTADDVGPHYSHYFIFHRWYLLFTYAQIPLDLSCRRPSLRLVGDQVADKTRTRYATFLFVGCPNSIGSILSETRSATFLFVENLSPTCLRPVADEVRDFFICRRPGPRLFNWRTCMTKFCNLFQFLVYWRTMTLTKLLYVVLQCYFAHQHTCSNLVKGNTQFG